MFGMTESTLGECAEWNEAHKETRPNETWHIRRIRRIYNGWPNNNSSPNTLNDIKCLRRMRRMNFSALGENGKWHKSPTSKKILILNLLPKEHGMVKKHLTLLSLKSNTGNESRIFRNWRKIPSFYCLLATIL